MSESQKLQRSHRTTPHLLKQFISRDDHGNNISQAKPLMSLTIKDFDEYLVSLPTAIETEISSKKEHKSPVNSPMQQVNKLLKIKNRASTRRDPDSFHKQSVNSDLKKSSDQSKKSLKPELTEAQKEELALKNQRKAMKRVAAMRVSTSKMYVNELWSRKHKFEVSSASSVAAENVQTLNSSSRSRQNSQEESALAFKRKFNKKIASELFSKYQNGIGISDKDITIDPPLYEQAIQSGFSSPSSRFLKSEYGWLQYRATPDSVLEVRRNSQGRNSKNELDVQEPNSASVASPSLLLKNRSINYPDTMKGVIIPERSQKLSHRSSLFDISSSHYDLKEISGPNNCIEEQEKPEIVAKSQEIEPSTSPSLFKMSNKLRRLVLAENTPRKDLSSRRELKSVRSKLTINTKSFTNNSKWDSTIANSIAEEKETKDKNSLRKVKSQNKSEAPKLICAQDKIRMRKQKENKMG